MKWVKLLVLGLAFWAVVGVAEIDSLDQEAIKLDQEAIKYSQQGQFELAVQKWEEARDKLAPDSFPQYMNISVNLAAAYQSLGRLREARNALLCAEPCISQNDLLRQATLKSQLADIYLVMGDSRPNNVQDEMMDNKIWCPVNSCVETITPPKPKDNVAQACNYLEDALNETPTDKPLLRANILNKQGNVSVAQKKYKLALEKYQDSAKQANQEGDKALAIKVSLNEVQTAIDILWAHRESVCFFRQVAEKVIEVGKADPDVSIIEDIGNSKIVDKLRTSLSEVKQVVNNLGGSNKQNDSSFENLLQNATDALEASIKETDGEKIGGNTKVVLELLKNDSLKTVFQQQTHKFVADRLTKIFDEIQTAEDKDIEPYDKAFNLMSIERLVQRLQALSTQKAQSCPLPSRLEVLKSLRLEQTKKLPVCSLSPLTQEEKLRFESLEKASKTIKSSTVQAYVDGYLAQLYAERRCYEQAIQLTRRAIDSVKNYLPLNTEDFEKLWGYPDQLYRWEWQLAVFLKEQGQTPVDEVMAVYGRAAEHLQSVRDHYRTLPQSFLEDAMQFYFDWADLLLQAANKETNLTKKTNLLKTAITGIESFKESELRNYFKDDCSVGTWKEHLKGVDRILPANTAVFYPMVLGDRVELLLSFANPEQSDNIIKQVRSPVRSIDLRHEVEKLREKMRPGSQELRNKHEFQYFPHAKKLYEWLIQPLISLLAENQIKTLIIIPDKVLRSTPFATLCKDCSDSDQQNFEGNRFLFQHYALVIAQGWELIDPREPQRKKDWNLTLLNGLTDPKSKFCSHDEANDACSINKVTMPEFGKLPNVKSELDKLQSLLGVAKENRLEENEFRNEPNVKGRFSNTAYFMVHFATHGYFDEDKDTSFLLACDGPLTLDELQELFKSPAVQETPVELLVLSACQSALGKEPLAALGLAGVAVKTGVRSAVGTLWPVSSGETTSLLVEKFYQQYKEGKSKAEALQEAQRQVALSNYDPFFWAPFVLIGNWR